MIRILLAGGGSGGHIFPAFALSYEIQKRMNHSEIMFAISGRPEERIIIDYIKKKISNFRTLIIPLLPLQGRGLFALFMFLFNFIRGSIYSFLIVLIFRPRLVVGFGGILSFPLILSAFLLGIPTLIHEQNFFPGKANRLLSYFANKVALSFEESKRYFMIRDKIIVTGNPLRPDLVIMDKKEAFNKLGLNPNLFTLLILGGSQGAHRINNYFITICEKIRKENLGLQIIHITGLKDLYWVAERYREMDICAKVFPFYDDISILYSAADLIVGRAGASTLNEISFFAKPAIAIPYPYARYHQLLNALYYAQRGGLFFFREEDLDKEATYNFICGIIKNREKQYSLSEGMRKINNPLATKLLADALEELIEVH